MAQVTLEMNGRSYTVGCGDGEEEHLVAIAKYVDTKLRELAGQVGPVGETRLFMLACLTLADELADAYHDAEDGRSSGEATAVAARLTVASAERQSQVLQERVAAIETRLAQREDTITRQLDHITTRLTSVAAQFDAD